MKDNIMKEARNDKKCGCLFCNSKCPACGSTTIRVRFKVEYEYRNDSMNAISIDQTDDGICLECETCGKSFEDDPTLDALRLALFKSLDLHQGTTEFPIDDHGKIEPAESIRQWT